MLNLISFLFCRPSLYLEHKIIHKKYLFEQRFGHFSSPSSSPPLESTLVSFAFTSSRLYWMRENCCVSLDDCRLDISVTAVSHLADRWLVLKLWRSASFALLSTNKASKQKISSKCYHGDSSLYKKDLWSKN